MNKRKLIGIAAVIAVIAVPLVIKFSGSKPKLEVELAAVSKKEIQPSILASGNFVFRQQVQLSSEVIGKVSEVLVKEGDKIQEGQVLLRLDPTLIKAEVTQQRAIVRSAQVNIERAQLNVDRQQVNVDRSRRLAEAKFIDTSKYEDAVHQFNVAKVDLHAARESMQQASAALDQALKRLDKTEVKAPISGTVTAVQIKIGETAVASATGMAGSSLMTIADVGSIMAEVNVDEADVAKVMVGQKVKVYPAAFDDQPVAGTVEEVSMAPKVALAGASQGKSYVVKLRLAETMLGIRTGMTCRVEIITGGGSPKPVLPIQAILTGDSMKLDKDAKESKDAKEAAKGAGVVFIVKDGVARKKEVKVGIADDNNQEILSGVAEGDMVVTGPARVLRGLRDGDQVKELKSADKADKASATKPASASASATSASSVSASADGKKP
ncbi:efflux RND transporter periplasmic adaptor subunit [Undibacterium flavidum]|uniref:Efflux RND transporter periplasmic adaptor subunit n=1 Tax=Undibacterium flavidum TaxID=2762297 RepID=A0ABR6YH23_9BURK|nr:efflux RND transporter periplasmic adaptor subunit [Undibacterium flavidum]MBC3875886.1 efflux RND transporter periplasmic adaptor subunit [Undibacterium flavidum]